ncbi:hypothetical protein SAMN02910358_01552 [Lachnospiraceae bacterium XBB1006]|nr:hypothetical protein SAMN02910358_01552 [Lachnospiraceae bacterium XBB1006]
MLQHDNSGIFLSRNPFYNKPITERYLDGKQTRKKIKKLTLLAAIVLSIHTTGTIIGQATHPVPAPTQDSPLDDKDPLGGKVH